MSVDTKTRVLIGGGLLLLLVSSAVNVLQAQRIQSLLSKATTANASVVGQKATPIAGVRIDGQKTTVNFDERRPTVLYYFSSTCGWCERNWKNVQALHDAAAGRYRLVAVSSERGLAEYVRRRQLGVEVVEEISENARAAYAFYGTPHTVVVDAEGVVTHEWRGAYGERTGRQIEELFGVALPGVRPLQTPAARD